MRAISLVRGVADLGLLMLWVLLIATVALGVAAVAAVSGVRRRLSGGKGREAVPAAERSAA